jgi:phosphate uptake regulator/aminoglycoside phosphotransferase (APT) family kinase protein
MASLVLHQLEQALSCFHTLDLTRAEEVIERDDMIDNFNLFLEGRCYDLVASGHHDGRGIRLARATAKVAANLERAGDAGTHIAKRVRLIHRERVERVPFDFPDVEAIALSAVTEATQSFLDADLELARRACLREPELDGCYVDRLAELVRLMQTHPAQVPYLVQCLSILKYLEKVADYTLNIGEQTIYCVTGRRLKFSQYLQLERLTGEVHVGAYDFRPYWDGISGAIVARVEAPETPMIYKEGPRRKIEEEAAKLETWQRIAQDLTPKILGSVSVKDRQALLREYVEGTLLSDLYLSSTPLEVKLRATRRVLAAVEFVWQTTLAATPPVIDYVEQIRERIADAFVLHLQLWTTAKAGITNGRRIEPLDTLLDRAAGLQARLAPPFSVWLHGDFNANNVIYNPETEQIKFIDVHRSKPGDYLQDLGVFLLSMVRRPDLTGAIEADVQAVNGVVEEFARAFARRRKDLTFTRRLKLSLARSCLSSIRIVIDPAMAERLLRRGMTLLDDLVHAE